MEKGWVGWEHGRWGGGGGDREGIDTDRERKVQKHAKMSRAK